MRIAAAAGLIGLSITVAAVAAVAAPAPAPSAAITAAVADAGRPQADKDRDPHRKPAELVALAGVKPGDKVAELIPAGGYYTRILSKVVGANGKIYAVSASATGPAAGPPAAVVSAYPNVTVVTAPWAEFKVPEPVDVVWTTENYHDLRNPRGPTDTLALDKAIFAALKPGGVYLVTDHAAAAGAGDTVAGTLHRIDPEFVKKEVIAAGFVLEAQSPLLSNPNDPHTGRSFDMHDDTDRMVLKFRKPAR